MSYQKPPIGSKINFGHSLARGLIGCWLFNEGSGDKVFDYSGQSNHGTITNVAAQSATSGWNAAPRGGTHIFDGSNDYITIPSLISVPGDFSVLFWMMNNNTTSFDDIFYFSDNVSKLCEGVIYGSATPKYFYVRDASNNLAQAPTNISVRDGLYHFCVYTFIRSTTIGQSYTDSIAGVPFTGHLMPLTFAAATNFIAKQVNGAQFKGGISSLFIFNRALSTSEIAYLYAFPYCMFDYQYPIYWGIGAPPPPPSGFTPRITIIM